MDLPTLIPPIRDPNYYFHDGNTVILVENTLFKVHRFQLVRDHSAFESMFSCPTLGAPPEEQEGDSDDNPIRLHGDCVEDVRALMGYLYSLHHEVHRDFSDDADFHTRCCLALIAHKYHFDSIVKWALDTITVFWKFRDQRSQTSASWLMETTRVAFQCDHADLIGIVTDSWIKVVKAGEVSEITRAINIAEHHGMPSVKGCAYYAMMILDRDVWDQDGVLTVPQRLRLLSGFHHLAQRCNLLEKQGAPEITHTACVLTINHTSPSQCPTGWINLWKDILSEEGTREAFVSLSPADYIGRLSVIADLLKELLGISSPSAKSRIAIGCLKSALVQVEAMSEECIRSLPDVFVDVK